MIEENIEITEKDNYNIVMKKISLMILKELKEILKELKEVKYFLIEVKEE